MGAPDATHLRGARNGGSNDDSHRKGGDRDGGKIGSPFPTNISQDEMLVFLSNISWLFRARLQSVSTDLNSSRTKMFCCECRSVRPCSTLDANPADMILLIETNMYCPGITWMPSTTAIPEGTRYTSHPHVSIHFSWPLLYSFRIVALVRIPPWDSSKRANLENSIRGSSPFGLACSVCH
jgi:hypothetical protein